MPGSCFRPSQQTASRDERAMKPRRISFIAVVALLGMPASAFAYWAATSSAGSNGSAGPATVNQGATPSVAPSATGRAVTISWGVSTLSNGAALEGYLVKRYPAGGGAATISPIGSCPGTG